MKIKLLFTTLLLFCLTALNAAPFKNVEKILTQPDGTKLHCYASGDEFYSRLHDKYAYFDECPEHINKYDEGGERVEYLKALLDAHMAADKCPEAKNPNKKPGGEKKQKIKDFGNDRMDHQSRHEAEAARIPAQYKIDLRRFVGDDFS